MSLKQIDLMTRESLVNLGIKIQLKGYNTLFNKPYIKKDELKKLILKEIKEIKKMRRTKSDQNINKNNVNKVDTSEDKTIRRSKSFSSFRKKSLKELLDFREI